MAFYFICHGVKGIDLSHIVKEVLEHCSETGLHVVAIVCDMGTNNVKALKCLGASFANPVFTFNNQEVVTIFDPHHLMKCARNRLQESEVLLNVEIGETLVNSTASWNHLLQACEIDARNSYRLMPSVKREHFELSGKSKMKVSLASQTLSHSMAAVIHTFVAMSNYFKYSINIFH